MVFAERLIIAVLAGSFGFVIGWLWWRNRTANVPDVRIENELRQQLSSREVELNSVRTENTRLASSFAASQAHVEDAQKQLVDRTEASLKLEERLRNSQIQYSECQAALATAKSETEGARLLLLEERRFHEIATRDVRTDHERALLELREAFKALSSDALRQTAPEFLRLANETFAKHQETARGELMTREQRISNLVQPLSEQLLAYQQRLQQAEAGQSSALGQVKQHLDLLAGQSQQLAQETQKLRLILSSNQARGRWGEETLRRVVEAGGLSVHCDFSEQTTEGESRPDLLVHLPGNRVIVVDAKVPDLDFFNGLNEADESKRREILGVHASRLRVTIKALADRDYPRHFLQALDYVVLFLPAESLFSAALEADRDLIVWAAERKILLATPASLIALLRSVSLSWQQHEQTSNARQISEAAQELFMRVTTFLTHLERIRKGLNTANEAFDQAVGSYERSVRPSGERLVKLGGAAPEKELPELVGLHTTLRSIGPTEIDSNPSPR